MNFQGVGVHNVPHIQKGSGSMGRHFKIIYKFNLAPVFPSKIEDHLKQELPISALNTGLTGIQVMGGYSGSELSNIQLMTRLEK